MQDLAEAQTGEAIPATLEQLSSSVPTITLLAALPALQVLGVVINKYLEAWQRIEEIRQTREKLSQLKIKGGTALQELTDEITSAVETVVEESTELVMKTYNGNRGELANAVRSDMRRLFGQIERGLTVEFGANAKGAQGDNEKTLQQIASVGRELKFPEVSREPLLLNSGEVLEDQGTDGGGVRLVRQSRTTTTRKTTTTSKESAEKAGKSD